MQETNVKLKPKLEGENAEDDANASLLLADQGEDCVLSSEA